jgi:hypothetical protein
VAFSYPKAPVEPTVRRCRFCKRPIRFIPGGHNLKAVGYVHIQPGAWLGCPVPSGEARP